MSTIQILKRNGVIEEYDPTKIRKILLAAGLETSKITLLISRINTWLNTQSFPVSTLLIRDQVLLELEKMDSYIAGLYRWYQKTKDPSISTKLRTPSISSRGEATPRSGHA